MKDKYFDFPVKKVFREEFVDRKGKVIFILEYEQATLNEYLEFNQKSQEEQALELYNFIHKQIPLFLFEKFFKLFNGNYIGKIEKRLNIDDLCIKIFQNKFRVYKSIYSGSNKIPRIPKKFYENVPVIMSASIANICEKYIISPLELLQNYTLEQYMWLNDWLIFIWNSLTEEGKKQNYNALVDKEWKKNNLKKVKEIFEKYNL